MDDYLVTQSNSLIKASYELTLNEKRLILLAIARLDGRKAMPEGVMKFSAIEFAEQFKLDKNHSYDSLRAASKFLYDRTIKRYSREGKLVGERRWIAGINYHDEEGCVSLEFHQQIAPLLTKLHKEFTSFRLRDVSLLKSFNSIRIYELAAQHWRIGSRKISLDELRTLLQLEGKYPVYKDLRRRVLDTAVVDINLNTDLDVVIEPITKGRRIIALNLIIAMKDTQLPLLPPDENAA